MDTAEVPTGPVPELLSRRIIRIVLRHRRAVECAGESCDRCERYHSLKVMHFVRNGLPVTFVLPAFPTKSPSRYKVIGHLPDLAEEIGLRHLQDMCEQIGQLYGPGARMYIASDGRVFNDLLHVPDEHVTAYQRELARMLDRFELSCLHLFGMEDVIEGQNFVEMRATLLANWGTSLDTLRAQVRAGDEPLRLYRGITRFLFEDSRYLDTGKSNTALQQQARANAYRVIQRSRAWGQLLQGRFPRAVRLSIHPQACSNPKLGVLLGRSRDQWLTPWHCVAVATSTGFVFMKRGEAEALGARLINEDGRPTHYLLTRDDDAREDTRDGRRDTV